ncbi:hypothetical protein [Nocardioides sp. YIM 152315]|uniref:hypothetical protein n=1 Tax=Nocardioides sp. YIM 152315 TaxID=3031760 RepID=UPI0023DB737D|nr:hypothetical protein [Nocardioides sp. YIM 152315]MDF1603384.1 hypothetical protein [Nocardioides sp. YIM 152315]
MRSYRVDGNHVDTPEPMGRAGLELRIMQLRAKQERMPAHWVERRAQVGDEIDALVDRWLLADE